MHNIWNTEKPNLVTYLAEKLASLVTAYTTKYAKTFQQRPSSDSDKKVIKKNLKKATKQLIESVLHAKCQTCGSPGPKIYWLIFFLC